MRKTIKTFISFVICIAFVLASIISAYASYDYDSKVEIKLEPEKGISINGRSVNTENPVIINGTLYLPLRTIFEAFGAEVSWTGENEIVIIYRGTSINLTLNSNICVVNQAEKTLSAPPIMRNGTTMVPVEVVTGYYDITSETDSSTGETSLILEDDGALTDLSFLTGGIGKQKAGNSYFGWCVNVPGGSRVSQVSFNSKTVQIENEHRGINITVDVDVDNGEDLAGLNDKLDKNPENYTDGEIINKSLHNAVGGGYIEILSVNMYEEAVVQRVFFKNGFKYSIALTSYNESNPKRLKDDKYYSGIIDSFVLNYDGSSKDVQDLSKIMFGLAKYENYVTSNTESNILAWDMSVLPEWSEMYSSSYNPYLTEIGASKKEYISVEINRVNADESIEDYCKNMLEIYNKNFNSKYYRLIESKIENNENRNDGKLICEVEIGGKKYIIDETFIKAGNLIYDITIKSPEDKYEQQKTNYYKMLESFEPVQKGADILEDQVERFAEAQENSRVSEEDGITEYKNPACEWSFNIPGYWIKNTTYDNTYQSFTNNESGAIIMVEALEKSEIVDSLSDEENFRFFSYMTSENVKFIFKENLNEKGHAVRKYTYTIENSDEDIYADMQVYVFDADKYSYCYISMIPQLCASEENLKELQDIWDSFGPVPADS